MGVDVDHEYRKQIALPSRVFGSGVIFERQRPLGERGRPPCLRKPYFVEFRSCHRQPKNRQHNTRPRGRIRQESNAARGKVTAILYSGFVADSLRTNVRSKERQHQYEICNVKTSLRPQAASACKRTPSARNFENRRKAWVAARAERLVQTLTAKASILGDL